MKKLKDKITILLFKYSPAIVGGWLVTLALSLYKWPWLSFVYLMIIIVLMLFSKED